MRKLQLDYIDGVRALLALYILLHHAAQFPAVLPPSLALLRYGQPVVAMFLTVSGFCLALPQASRGAWTLDAARFYRRRATRILPPYFVALAIAVAVSAGFVLRGPFRDPVGEFSFQAVWSHLLLVQNWMPRQMYTLNGALWSIAVECQVYLLYPALVATRRRWGVWVLLLLVAVVSLGGFRLFHAVGQVHFLLFFGMGMISAEVAFGRERPWLTLGGMGLAIAAAVLLPHASQPQQEILAALGCASLLAYLYQSRSSPVRRALQWKPLAWTGTFSYSIYLLHGPFLFIAWYWVRNRRQSFGVRFDWAYVMVMVAASVLALAGSYGFHVAFERPFMGGKRQQAEQRMAAAVV